MNWMLMRFAGLILLAVGAISFWQVFSDQSIGRPSMLPSLTIFVIGALLYFPATNKLQTDNAYRKIRDGWKNRGYPSEEIERLTKLTEQALRERKVWPNFGMNDQAKAVKDIEDLEGIR